MSDDDQANVTWLIRQNVLRFIITAHSADKLLAYTKFAIMHNDSNPNEVETFPHKSLNSTEKIEIVHFFADTKNAVKFVISSCSFNCTESQESENEKNEIQVVVAISFQV